VSLWDKSLARAQLCCRCVYGNTSLPLLYTCTTVYDSNEWYRFTGFKSTHKDLPDALSMITTMSINTMQIQSCKWRGNGILMHTSFKHTTDTTWTRSKTHAWNEQNLHVSHTCAQKQHNWIFRNMFDPVVIATVAMEKNGKKDEQHNLIYRFPQPIDDSTVLICRLPIMPLAQHRNLRSLRCQSGRSESTNN
jgi:hypothetical protein